MSLFSETVDNLIQINESNRELMKKYKNSYTSLTWAKDFCTVYCNAGRAVGKTTYINGNVTKDDLIIIRFARSKELYTSMFAKNVYTFGDIVGLEKIRGKNIDKVYIDDGSHFDKFQLEDLYLEILRDEKEHQFILLG